MSKYQPSNEERTVAMLAQVLAIPAPWVAPLIVLLVERQRSAYVRYWAKVVLYWQIFWVIGLIVSALLCAVLIGFLTTPLLIGANLTFCVIGAVKAYYNEPFGYWFVAARFCKADYELLYGPEPSAAAEPVAPEPSAAQAAPPPVSQVPEQPAAPQTPPPSEPESPPQQDTSGDVREI